jgi:hypothetical protein
VPIPPAVFRFTAPGMTRPYLKLNPIVRQW